MLPQPDNTPGFIPIENCLFELQRKIAETKTPIAGAFNKDFIVNIKWRIHTEIDPVYAERCVAVIKEKSRSTKYYF